jgi:hypothetical protein
MGTPGSLPTRLTAVPDKWVRPTRRPVDLTMGPQPSRWPTRPLEDLPEDSQTTLSRTTSRLGVQGKMTVDSDKQTSVCGNSCKKLDLGLLVVTDQESGYRPCSLANIRQARRPLVQSRNPQAIYTDN